jgi:hypothetical protein
MYSLIILSLFSMSSFVTPQYLQHRTYRYDHKKDRFLTPRETD